MNPDYTQETTVSFATEKNILHASQVKLRCEKEDTPAGCKYPPVFQLYTTNGMPRVAVYTNDDSKKDNGRITASLDPIIFEILMMEIDRFATEASLDGQKIVIGNGKNFDPQTQKGTEEVVVTTRLVVGRENGRVYIALLGGKQHHHVKFFFTIQRRFHSYLNSQGQSDQVHMNNMAARAWVRFMSKTVPAVCAQTWKEPEKKQNGNRQGGGGGGYNNQNRGNYGGGGGQSYGGGQAASQDDDDLGF